MTRILRFPLLRIARLLLRLRARTLTPFAGPLLIVAPHPDDESLGCGGLVARECAVGHAPHIVFLTDGTASHRGHPVLSPAKLGDLRRAEACQAIAALGVPVDHLIHFDLPDGELPHLAPERRNAAVQRLTAVIDELRPAAVLVSSRHDGSSEHLAAAVLVGDALRGTLCQPRGLGYLVWSAYSPRLLLRVAFGRARVFRLAFPEHAGRKARALAAYASQFAPTPPWTEPVQPAAFRAAFAPAEEFFVDSLP